MTSKKPARAKKPAKRAAAARKGLKTARTRSASAVKKTAKKTAKKVARKATKKPVGRPVRGPAKKAAGKGSAKPAKKRDRAVKGAGKGTPAAAPKAAAKKAATSRRRGRGPFGKRDLQGFLDALLHLRAHRLGDKESREKEALKAAGQDVSVDHMADFGSDNYEQEFTLGLLEHDIETLRDINDALMRIREGSYGLCEECGEPVAKARLRAIPYARLCVECKMKEE